MSSCSFCHRNGASVHRVANSQQKQFKKIHYLFLTNNLKISLKAKAPNESPIHIHHCEPVRAVNLKSDCIAGTSMTESVIIATRAIVAHNHLFVKKRLVKNALPLLMLKIMVNCEKIITANVIVRATSIECCEPIK